MLCVSRCPDREVLKLCMEFWRTWSHDIADTYGVGKVCGDCIGSVMMYWDDDDCDLNDSLELLY